MGLLPLRREEPMPRVTARVKLRLRLGLGIRLGPRLGLRLQIGLALQWEGIAALGFET